MGSATIGVDVGQRVDPSAIAVVETEPRDGPPRLHQPAWGLADAPPRVVSHEDHFVCRYLERVPPATSYPDVAARVAAVARAVAVRTRQQPTLYVDATGVGTPLVDILKRADVRCPIRAVYFTHGDRRTEDGGEVRLGKAWLVSRLQALLQTQRLHLPRTPEAEILAKELLDYEIKVSEDANDRYGAFKVGTHDDLVTALGLAVLEEPYVVDRSRERRVVVPKAVPARVVGWQ